MGKGNNNTISISKIKKITPNRKNRRENGSRALFLGSNPHSKGDLFWRSNISFLEMAIFKINNTTVRIRLEIKKNK